VGAGGGETRQHDERTDAEHRGPAPGRSDHVVDDEAELEKAVLAFGPWLLEESMGWRCHVASVRRWRTNADHVMLHHTSFAELRMRQDEKILITGPAGRIGSGLARRLAADNEVWGIARFRTPGSQKWVDEMGVTTRAIDIADGEFDDLPTDFTYVLHIAHAHGD